MDTHPVYAAEREGERESWAWNIQCMYSSINLNSVMIHNPLFSTTIHALGIRTREECRHKDGGTFVNYLREIRFVMDDDSLDLLILWSMNTVLTCWNLCNLRGLRFSSTYCVSRGSDISTFWVLYVIHGKYVYYCSSQIFRITRVKSFLNANLWYSCIVEHSFMIDVSFNGKMSWIFEV